MDLIIHCMSNYIDWPPNGLFVNRNFHILQMLRAQPGIDKILIIDCLPFGWKKQLRNYLMVRPEMKKFPLKKKFGLGTLYQVDEGNTFVYTTYRNILRSRDREVINKQIHECVTPLELKDLLLWSYHPFSYRAFESKKYKFKVFDAVDDWRKHDIHKPIQPIIDKAYKSIADRADVVFGVSEESTTIFKDNPNSFWIPNGVDVNHFSKESQYLSPKVNDVEVLERIQKLKGPKIGYLGIVESRIDPGLVEYLARMHPRSNFIFAGKVFPTFEGKYLKKFKNVQFLGQISYNDAPAFLQLMDVGIVPHKITSFTRSMNPLKIYEYLATGLPVITTPVAGSDIFRGMVSVAETKEEFSSALTRELGKEQTPEMKFKRKEFVKPFSWEKRFEEMLKHLPINDQQPTSNNQ